MSATSAERPLVLSPGMMTRNKNVYRRATDQFKPARKWVCRPCALFLGVSHIILACILLVIDVSSNRLNKSLVATSSSLCFFTCGILSLIGSRRLDRGTIILYLIASIAATILSTLLMIERLYFMKNDYDHLKEALNQTQKDSLYSAIGVCIAILTIAMTEICLSLTSIFITCQSLCFACADVLTIPVTPFAALLGVEDFIGEAQITPICETRD
uniref:Transmembrane protein n=1 Tax=Romanomermis culicivorax TaxID=13658 RepID=A0A915JIM1_ROMCU